MKVEDGKIERDMQIQSEFELRGMITGNVTVKDGGVLYLHGMITKDLIVQEGGTVYLYGLVSGDVINQGGRLGVYGLIHGKLNEISGNTFIDNNAVIRAGRI